MGSKLNPYLNFTNNSREAMEFYHSVLGGDLHINTFGEFGQEVANPDGVMHATLNTEAGYTLMASDDPTAQEAPKNGNISLTGDDADLLRGYFTQLSQGGTMLVELDKQVWGDEFGMFVDKFGVQWLFNIATPA